MIVYHTVKNGILKAQEANQLDVVPANTLWIDVLHPSPEEEHFVEGALSIDIPSPEEMAEIEDSSRFFENKNSVCMTISVIKSTQESNPILYELSFVLTKNQLVTAHYGELVAFRSFENQYSRQPQVYKSADALMMALVNSQVDRIADILEKLQNKLNGLSQGIFSDGQGQYTDDLQHTVKLLGQYNSLLAKLSDSVLGIKRLLIFAKQTVEWLTPEARTQMRAIDQDITSLTEYHTRMSSEITFLLDATLGLINIEQNSIIKVFSIAAVLFLPPTLVGTVYGMNFNDMPELHWSFGYPLSLGIMGLSALGCYAWFKIKKWL